jgi:hypothetical protein
MATVTRGAPNPNDQGVSGCRPAYPPSMPTDDLAERFRTVDTTAICDFGLTAEQVDEGFATYSHDR